MSGDTEERALPTRMTIRRAGTASARSADAIATGPVWVELLFESRRDGDVTMMRVTIDPGIVTHWHTHPRGQMLYVLSGIGFVQRDGGPIEALRAGDCVWLPPGERHWHGASPNGTFSYLCVQAVENGAAVHWHEPVASVRGAP